MLGKTILGRTFIGIEYLENRRQGSRGGRKGGSYRGEQLEGVGKEGG